MADKYYLSEADRRALNRFLRAEKNEIFGDPSVDQPTQVSRTMDTYVAMLPCGENIPARFGDTPGHRRCCIFRIDTGDSEDSFTITPMLAHDGTQLRRDVFNIYSVEVPAQQPPDELYLKITRDKYGRWLCEYPSETSGPADPTTTSTTTIPPCDGGYCKWVWGEANNSWSLSHDYCRTTTTSTSTTTTTTTTEDPESTTTTEDPNGGCLCPPEDTTTTSSTTSTTTENPCKCTYPDFCGLEDGDCAYTTCVQGDTSPSVDCTTTTTTTSTTSTTSAGTTTTCDCNTTTTAAPDPECTVGCDWIWHPAFGYSLISSGCDTTCPCPYPDGAGGDICAPAHTDCVKPPVIPPPQPFCHGGCIWWWIPGQDAWILWESHCDGNVPCYCSYPSQPGGDCSAMSTPCQTPTTTTTQPPEDDGPCADCYTTTTTTSTTTTTTPGPCDEGCLFRWSPGSETWDNEEQNCDDDCPCYPPSAPGHFECEVMKVPCVEGSTTTTTSTSTTSTTSTTTTTTCAPCDEVSSCGTMYQWRNGAWAYITDQCNECDGHTGHAPLTPGSPCDCETVPCVTSTTTTTTTTCDPNACNPLTPDADTYMCVGGSWVTVGGDCDNGLQPGPPTDGCDEDNNCECVARPCLVCGSQCVWICAPPYVGGFGHWVLTESCGVEVCPVCDLGEDSFAEMNGDGRYPIAGAPCHSSIGTGNQYGTCVTTPAP